MPKPRNSWLAFVFVMLPLLALAQAPPVVRSVLTTNLPAFGSTGQALFRTATLPYLNWSNVVATGSGADAVLSNYYQTNWGVIYSNALTAKLDSNIWFAAWGSLSSNAITGKLDSNVWWAGWGALGTNALTPKLDSNVWRASWGSLGTNGLTEKLDSNVWWTAWGSLSSNSISDKLDSNTWWTGYGSKVLTNSGQFISSDTGFGTNTTFQSSAATSVPLVVSNYVGNTTNSLEVTGTNGITGGGLVVDSFGRVGIGTNLPTGLLTITGTNGPYKELLRIENKMVANATNLVVVGTNNSVGIRTSPSGNYALESGGLCSFSGYYAGLYQQLGSGTGRSAIWGPPSNSTNSYYYGGFDVTNTMLTISNGTSTRLPKASFVNASTQTNIANSSQILFGHGTNDPQSPLHVAGNNAQDYVVQFGTTNKSRLFSVDTNGNTMAAGIFIATNGLAYVVSNSFIGNLVIVTNNPQIYCVNGTNQLITLPDCTKIPVGQIIRFSSTNGYGTFVLTNATGSQTIRDGSSLDYKGAGVSSVAFFNDGAAWWIASKAKTIWPNASWSTSTNVPFAVATSNYITFDTLETSNAQGISLTNGYQIYVRDPGQYLLTFSLVMQVGHNNDTNRVWLQQSAQNIPRTRTDVKLSSTADQVVMTVNFVLPVVTNLTWFGVVLRSTDTGAQLVTGAAASAIMPAMPSAIVTVNKISDSFP